MPSVEVTKQRKFKRLFFDIETSPNLVFSWNVGRKINIDYDNIIKERAIICICYKWAGESKVHSLKWKSGNDRKMLIDFIKIINEADEVLGHNSDNFDIKWLRTRCIFHSVPMFPTYTSVDTYKLAKSGFRFNSNRLNYIGKYLGVGKKIHTDFDLWKAIVLHNDKSALGRMITYCQQDVRLLEKVFDKLNPYVKHKTHVGVLKGQSNISCPECGNQCRKNGSRITATGGHRQMWVCNSCGKYHTTAVPKKEQ